MMKKKETSNHVQIKNFNTSNFTTNNSFFVPLIKYKNFLKNINPQKDLIDENDLMINLKKKINAISENINNQTFSNNITLSNEFYNAFKSLNEIKKDESSLAKNIKQIIDNNKGKRLTLKFIANEYQNTFNINLSLMTISRVMRNHLGYHYRKTTVKNPKLLDDDSILMSFIFLKIILRAIELGLNLIYLDEVGFSLENQNFYTWKKKDDLFYGGAKINQKVKLNAILSINENEILYGKLLNKTIDSDDFILYIEELLERISKEDIKNSLIIMDNAKFHVSKKVTQYFKDKNIKIITIVPYLSTFNSIELLFRAFKNKMYKETYKNMKELRKRVTDLINDENMSKIVQKNFVETLNVYKKYFDEYKNTKNLDVIKRKILNKKRRRNKCEKIEFTGK